MQSKVKPTYCYSLVFFVSWLFYFDFAVHVVMLTPNVLVWKLVYQKARRENKLITNVDKRCLSI